MTARIGWLLMLCCIVLAGCRSALCDEFTVDADMIGIAHSCNGYHMTMSEIQTDPSGRQVSFSYDVACADASEHYAGKVSGIQYAQFNPQYIIAFDATINGQTCHYQR